MIFKILKEPEIKKLIGSSLIILIIFSIISFLYYNKIMEKLNQQYIKKNQIIVGTLVKKHKDIEDDIVKMVVNGYKSKDYEYGEKILKKYGYDEKLSIKDNFEFYNVYNDFRGFLFMIFLFFILLYFLITIININRFYNMINEFSMAISKVMSGEFETSLVYEGEGKISMLAFQFNQMAKRLRLTMLSLNEEKTKLKELISNISHQLKTPLASIKTFNEILIEGEDENRELRMDFLKHSKTQIEKMEWLINSLLKISRLEAGVINFNKQENNIVNTLKLIVEGVSIIAEKKEQYIKFTYSEEEIKLLYDDKWIGEAIKNIIDNSIKYTKEKGIIQIDIQEIESSVKIYIIDNGIGISKEKLSSIFEKFKGKDTGLGLFLSKLIIEKHDGFIQVNSEVSKGTKFVITFPKLTKV